jgi:hypothetical protein
MSTHIFLDVDVIQRGIADPHHGNDRVIRSDRHNCCPFIPGRRRCPFSPATAGAVCLCAAGGCRRTSLSHVLKDSVGVRPPPSNPTRLGSTPCRRSYLPEWVSAIVPPVSQPHRITKAARVCFPFVDRSPWMPEERGPGYRSKQDPHRADALRRRCRPHRRLWSLLA